MSFDHVRDAECICHHCRRKWRGPVDFSLPVRVNIMDCKRIVSKCPGCTRRGSAPRYLEWLASYERVLERAAAANHGKPVQCKVEEEVETVPTEKPKRGGGHRGPNTGRSKDNPHTKKKGRA